MKRTHEDGELICSSPRSPILSPRKPRRGSNMRSPLTLPSPFPPIPSSPKGSTNNSAMRPPIFPRFPFPIINRDTEGSMLDSENGDSKDVSHVATTSSNSTFL
ncbi:hypothetical protein EON65_44250, partial [archaeon]